jgi:hypothetical protein
MPDTNIKKLKEIDRSWSGGLPYEEASIRKAELYEDRARTLTLSHLKKLGQGDPDLAEPVTTGGNILARIIEELASLYRVQPTRRLVVAGEELADDDPDQVALGEVLEAAQYGLGWQQADEMRTLHRQVVLSFVESVGSVQLRIFEPFNFFRAPDANLGPDNLDADRCFALQIRGSSDANDDSNLYQLWENYGTATPGREDWRMWLVNESGEPVGDQPYGDEGLTPFIGPEGGRISPSLLVYDELPRGRAYLPGGDSRVSSALAINAAMNDLNYLVKHQAHGQIVSEGDDQRGIPTEHGPGKIWNVGSDHRIYPLNLNPAIGESSGLLDHHLRLWATSEGLAADRFLQTRNLPSGVAMRTLERPLSIRRERQTAMALALERVAYSKFRAVHNAMSQAYGLPELREDATMRITVTRQDAQQDPKEYQEAAFKDLAIGALDIVDYVMTRRGCSREEARRYLARARQSLVEFPLIQNPASMTEGPGAAGVNGAKTNGEFHPEIAATVEQNSTTGAIERLLEVPPGEA